MNGICKLCNKKARLQNSHILSAFVFKQFKEKSATGRIISVKELDKLTLVQDGHKPHFLCLDCERLFNRWETKFAQQIFHPFSNNLKSVMPYDSWLLKFCVSISWRILTYCIENKLLPDFPEDLLQKAKFAQSAWNEFLLEQREHPSQYEQHLLPFSPFNRLGNCKLSNLPRNINRYILGSIAIDVIHNKKDAYVYAKLGRIVIIGFINTEKPKYWNGTKVHLKHGVIKPEVRTVPEKFTRYFNKKANEKIAIQAQITEKNRKVILDNCRKDLKKVRNSETLKAALFDYQIFGEEAFNNHN